MSIDNIRVVSGDKIPSPGKVTPWNYHHMRITFDKVDILDAKPQESDYSSLNKKMEGRSCMVYIHRINSIIGKNDRYFGTICQDRTFEIAGGFKSKPSGTKTSYGAIITNMFFGDDNYNALHPDDVKLYEEVEEGLDDGMRRGGIYYKSSMTNDYYGESEIEGKGIFNTLLDNIDCLGQKDFPNIQSRSYLGTLKKYNEDKDIYGGACALCYYIEDSLVTVVKDETTSSSSSSTDSEQKKKVLHENCLTFEIGKGGDRGNKASGEPDETYPDGDIQVTIFAKSNEMELVVNDSRRTVSFPKVTDEDNPNNCVDVGNNKLADYLILYPSYYGICFRNSMGKIGGGRFNSKQDTSNVQEVILNGDSKSPLDPWSDIRIYEYDSDSGEAKKPYTDSMRKYLSRNEGHDMEFFPKILHETKSKEDLRLRVGKGNKMYIYESPQVLFKGCVGRFGLARVVFFNHLVFTMYFKGIYVENINSYKNKSDSSKEFYYLAYPVVHYDKVMNGKAKLRGMNKYGAKCIRAVPVCSSKSKRETIYKVEVDVAVNKSEKGKENNATSYELLRSPIEVLGIELVLVRKEFQFTHLKGNGTFMFCNNGVGSWIRPQYSGARQKQLENSKKYMDLITGVNVTVGVDGVSGTMELDGYPIGQGIAIVKQSQSVGEVDLGVSGSGSIFSGYGLEASTSGTEGNYAISVKLEGVQRKMSDMNLVCAPFWDGDRLEAICLYFEQYMNLKLKMIDHTVHSISGAKNVSSNPFSSSGTWVSKNEYVTSANAGGVEAFRVPRSFHWESPAVNFKTGTSCLEALNKLAELTGCQFCVGPDGVGYFYELNKFGYPYFVDNQSKASVAKFDPPSIVSVNVAPIYDNWYNSIATFGFIRKGQKKTAEESPSFDNVIPGVEYTKTTSSLFPWSRFNVGVESGFLTKDQLAQIHDTRVKFSGAERGQGSITVLGNNQVTHMYQVIKVCGVYFFVTQISHSIDVGRKLWTTSYQIVYLDIGEETFDPWA